MDFSIHCKCNLQTEKIIHIVILINIIKIHFFLTHDTGNGCHLHLSLKLEGHWGTTDDFKLVSSIFLCSPLPSGTWLTPGLSIP